jgi:hypothetical protein
MQPEQRVGSPAESLAPTEAGDADATEEVAFSPVAVKQENDGAEEHAGGAGGGPGLLLGAGAPAVVGTSWDWVQKHDRFSFGIPMPTFRKILRVFGTDEGGFQCV